MFPVRLELTTSRFKRPVLYQLSYENRIKYNIPATNVNTFNSNELGRTRTYNSVFFLEQRAHGSSAFHSRLTRLFLFQMNNVCTDWFILNHTVIENNLTLNLALINK